MARLQIDPGRLNREIVLEAPVSQPDGAGGLVTGYTEAARFFAAVEPLGPAEGDNSGFAVTSRLFRLVFRTRTDITMAHRLRLGARILVLESLADPDETGRFLVATAREETP